MFTLSFEDKRNKEAEFEVIYYRYIKLMYRCAYEILQDKSLAEDAVQDAFLRILKHLDSIEEGVTNRNINFVYTITKHTAINLYNKRKKSELILDNIEAKRYGEDNFNLDLDLALDEALQELSEEERELLMLKYVYNFSQGEIAELLGIKRTTAGVRIKRAKDKLAKLIRR